MVKISYNSQEEMMHIETDNGTVFYGNYSDFKRDPDSLYKLFVSLGLSVKKDEDLPSIG